MTQATSHEPPATDDAGTGPRDIIVRAEQRVAELLRNDQLALPPGYAWQNALRGAWLHLQQLTVPRGPDKGKPMLQIATQASVANSLLDMVVQGLAVHNRQGYFILYSGDQLQFQRSYFGSITVGRRVLNLQHADAQVVYEGDTLQFTIDRGRYQITRHDSSLANMMTANIIAAYVVLAFDDSTLDRADLMTWDDIKASWSKSKTAQYDDSPHKTFAAEMAKRTVISRALKTLINSATDDHLLLAAWNRDADDEAGLQIEAHAETANTLPLPVDIDDDDDAELVDVPQVALPDEPKDVGERRIAAIEAALHRGVTAAAQARRDQMAQDDDMPQPDDDSASGLFDEPGF